MPGSEVPTFEDIKEITIRRSNLAKWFMEPFFEEFIVGCFVRVGIGRSNGEPNMRKLLFIRGSCMHAVHLKAPPLLARLT